MTRMTSGPRRPDALEWPVVSDQGPPSDRLPKHGSRRIDPTPPPRKLGVEFDVRVAGTNPAALRKTEHLDIKRSQVELLNLDAGKCCQRSLGYGARVDFLIGVIDDPNQQLPIGD